MANKVPWFCTRPLAPWDTGAYDTSTVIPDSLGSVGIYNLIGIISNLHERIR